MYSFNSLLSVFFSSCSVGWSDLAAQTYKHTNNKPTSVMVNCHHVLMWCLVSAILLCWRSSCFLPAPHCLFPPHKQLSMYPAMWWLVWSIKRFTNSLIFWRGGGSLQFESFDIDLQIPLWEFWHNEMSVCAAPTTVHSLAGFVWPSLNQQCPL